MLDLFPEGVVVVVATPEMYEADPFEEEKAHVAKAVEKRRREFVAGRAAARAAMAELGFESVSLPAAGDRSPIWPAGVVGSISHTRGCCVAAVARADRFESVGVDVEEASPLKEDLIRMICTDREKDRIARLPPGLDWGKVTFSAKEAFYKCYHPVTKTFLGFHDVELAIDPIRMTFIAEIIRREKPLLSGRSRLGGRLFADASHVYSGVAVERAAPTP